MLLGGRGRIIRTTDGRAHRTLHTQTHHKHALRLQKWRSTSRFLPRCVVDYGCHWRREVLGGYDRCNRSLRRLQCDNSFPRKPVVLHFSSNRLTKRGSSGNGLYEKAVHWPCLHNLLILVRRPNRLGIKSSLLLSYNASNKHGRSRSVSLEAARACRSAVFTRSDERNVSLIILMSP